MFQVVAASVTVSVQIANIFIGRPSQDTAAKFHSARN
jgi:hypothetical protein